MVLLEFLAMAREFVSVNIISMGLNVTSAKKVFTISLIAKVTI